MTTLTPVTTHAWEKLGFVPPYKCHGVYSLDKVMNLADVKESPLGFHFGTCDVCGTALMNNYMMTDALNKKFVVGCDCVEKTGLYELIHVMKGYKRDFEKNREIAKKTAATKARLAAERLQNNGLTNDEVKELAKAAEKQAFYDLHKELFDKVQTSNNSFAINVMETCVYYKSMSDKQRELLESAVRLYEESLTALNEFYGKVGDKVTLELTTLRMIAMPSAYGVNYLVILKDNSGRTFKYSGSTINAFPDKHEKATLTFSIKAHTVYEDVNQTVIQRVKSV